MKATLVVAGIVCLGLAAFCVIDLSAEANPSWAERRLAFGLLEARIVMHGIPAPPPSDTSGDVRSAQVYQQRCAFCHGGIDGSAAGFAQALSPRPPQFVVDRPRASVPIDAYIIKHGIRWTGMPAFKSMSDADAWRLAAYVHHVRKDTVLDPLAGMRPYLAGLTVPDADSAARWYHDMLEFTENGASTVNGVRQVVMERGAYAIELFSTHGSSRAGRGRGGVGGNAPLGAQRGGFSKLGFYVDDLTPVLAELRARHVQIVRDLTTLKQFQIRFILIRDIYGDTLQLFDRRV
jgi:mono/diheme cytochrome c family protein/catechol 2,3-dioxygenase-like lactoylglutathione lyase family enzyme